MKQLVKSTRSEMDIISNLPWDVLDTILVHLPLREAARTSILSSKWRHKWIGLSQFVFDDKCFASSLSDNVGRWHEIMKIIDKIRSNNSGQIQKFELAAYCCPDYADLDLWILFLTEKGIKEFILQDFNFVKRFKLPSCLFSCSQLTRLDLYGCIIKLPSIFKGFKCLKSLRLTQVSIRGDTLQSLILDCPFLERLTLLNMAHLAFVKIHSQRLKYLRIVSEFEDICLENSPLLASVDIHLIPRFGSVGPRRLEQGRPCNLVRVFDCLCSIERLTLSSHFLQFLANDNVPERLPTTLPNLTAIELKELRFDSFKEVAVSFSVLKSSPNLEQLVISVFNSHDAFLNIEEYIKAQCETDLCFNKLKVVKIRGIRGSRTEGEFIKFILTHSPVLENFIIVKYDSERLPEPMLQKFECASKQVKIVSLSL